MDPTSEDIECMNTKNRTGSTPPGRALCYVYYKIQRGSDEDFNSVKRRTGESREWDDICFGEDQWPYIKKDASGIVCIPIETGPEFREGLQTLANHFGDVYIDEL